MVSSWPSNGLVGVGVCGRAQQGLEGIGAKQSRRRGIATHVRLSGSFFPVSCFQLASLGPSTCKNMSQKGRELRVEREGTLSSSSKRNREFLLSATLHVPMKSPPTRSASPRIDGVFVKRFGPLPILLHHVHIGVRFYLTITRARHVTFLKIGGPPASLLLNSASTRGLLPVPQTYTPIKCSLSRSFPKVRLMGAHGSSRPA